MIKSPLLGTTAITSTAIPSSRDDPNTPIGKDVSTSALLLSVVLVTTMIVSTFQIFAIGVLASQIIEDLGITRWTLGIAGSVNTLTGGLSAPLTGKITDRIDPARSVLVLCLLGSAGMATMMASSNVWILIASCVLSGIPQGWGNSVTNALIAQRVQAGQRGVITGVKQSGVTAGVFLAGATLPSLSAGTDWRMAAGVFALIFGVFAVVNGLLLSRLPAQPPCAGNAVDQARQPADRQTDAIPTFVWKMTVFAFLMGTSSGAIGRFLPLFAEEAVGMSTTSAGMLLAVVGVCGIAFRIAAARAAERRIPPPKLLFVLSLVAVSTSVMLAAAPTIGPWLLWPTAVLYALGHISWNSVVHLAIISDNSPADAGRLSGIVMLGFLLGMTIGAPITGLVADNYGTYQPVWLATAGLAIGSALTMRPTAKAR